MSRVDRALLCVLMSTAFVIVASAHTTPAPVTAPKPCTGAAYHEFDFTAGDWDVFDVAAPTVIVARNHITPMVDGCALREVYEQRAGLRGESFSVYDSTTWKPVFHLIFRAHVRGSR